MQEYLTPTEVAAALKVTPRAVYDWLREGKLRGYNIGRWRIHPADVEAFLKAGDSMPPPNVVEEVPLVPSVAPTPSAPVIPFPDPLKPSPLANRKNKQKRR